MSTFKNEKSQKKFNVSTFKFNVSTFEKEKNIKKTEVSTFKNTK